MYIPLHPLHPPPKPPTQNNKTNLQEYIINFPSEMAVASYDKCSPHPPLSFSFFISCSAPETKYSLTQLSVCPQPFLLSHTWPPEHNIQYVVYEQPNTHTR